MRGDTNEPGVPALDPGNLDAAQLFERYGEQLYRFCLGRLRDREEAADALQNTFLRVHVALSKGIVPKFESAWLYKIAHNVCLSRIESAGRRAKLESPSDFDNLEYALAAPESDRDELEGLSDALADLPPNLRRAILLREWQGLAYAEIAEAMETTVPAVETLLYRARRQLTAALREGGRRARAALSGLLDLLGVRALLQRSAGLVPDIGGAKLAAGAALLAVGGSGAGVAVVVATSTHSPARPRPTATATAASATAAAAPHATGTAATAPSGPAAIAPGVAASSDGARTARAAPPATPSTARPAGVSPAAATSPTPTRARVVRHATTAAAATTPTAPAPAASTPSALPSAPAVPSVPALPVASTQTPAVLTAAATLPQAPSPLQGTTAPAVPTLSTAPAVPTVSTASSALPTTAALPAQTAPSPSASSPPTTAALPAQTALSPTAPSLP